MRIMALIALLLSLFGCTKNKVQKLDGDGSVYRDEDYRTVYANVLDFKSSGADKYWAVAFLGYGDEGKENRELYIESLFSELSNEAKENIKHYDFEGDEWYLVVPRYKDINDIVPLYENGASEVVAGGEAFTVKCNFSHSRPNLKISIDSFGGKEFSPSLDGQGRLCSENVIDITKYESD